jgi:hypothetical protein
MTPELMTAQTPAEGIFKHREWGDSVMYGVPCECTDSNHQHNVWIEADETGVTVTTYTQQKTRWWELNRWQVIWRLLTTGYVEYEASIIMSEQQALNYAETLKKAVPDVKQFRDTRQAKSVA